MSKHQISDELKAELQAMEAASARDIDHAMTVETREFSTGHRAAIRWVLGLTGNLPEQACEPLCAHEHQVSEENGHRHCVDCTAFIQPIREWVRDKLIEARKAARDEVDAKSHAGTDDQWDYLAVGKITRLLDSIIANIDGQDVPISTDYPPGPLRGKTATA